MGCIIHTMAVINSTRLLLFFKSDKKKANACNIFIEFGFYSGSVVFMAINIYHLRFLINLSF